MSSGMTHADKTGAADKSIGFDYQYYYFLNCVLSLKKGESAGIEVKDDVHTDLNNQCQVLVQTKHTTQVLASGKPKNLTTYDNDLWKTLFNWSRVICDPVDGRATEKAQLEFISKTTFCLATNKSQTVGNKVVSVIESLADGVEDVSQARVKLQDIRNGTKDGTLQTYIDAVQALSDKTLNGFLNNVVFETGLDDIILKVKDSIREKMVPVDRVESIFKTLDSAIREDNFIKIKNGEDLVISFEEFYRKYRRYFDIERSPTLRVRNDIPLLPDDLNTQTFIAQLCDIGDMATDDDELIAEYTRCKLFLSNNLEAWHQEGDITGQEKEEFHREAINRWKIHFRSKYHGNLDESVINAKALEILFQMRLEKFSIALTDLPTDMCNGEYYHLSDIPEIGWHKNWKEKYKP